MRIPKTAVLVAMAVFAAGCTATEDSGAGGSAPTESAEDRTTTEPVEDRPIYAAGVSEEDFCPTGEEIEELESTPESDQVELWHNGTMSLEGTVDPAPEELHCSYFYMEGDAPADRITDDIATPVTDLVILEEQPDPEDSPALDPAEFPEFPEYFQVTGWDHTATEEETETCLMIYLYGDCEDGETLVMEIFTLTGYDSNLQVQIQVEYRYAGDPAESGSDRAAEIESQSRQIAGELLPVLIDRVPTEEA
ncbi:hypothetical protein [Glycomyces buryatensis]|uniref:DUF3558 domain-containing protein n=1 Tax=Glycomyces buryatensis TaxID=2570927 RepID=A0A4S8QPX1_9ACTN|nr:hypothetical protein [Glycomyces buryatensis]THV42764.1 hypothetical protein FAB82_04380 [Glycomyces buryatensis]